MKKYSSFLKYNPYILQVVLFVSVFSFFSVSNDKDLWASPASCAKVMTLLSNRVGGESSAAILRLTGRSLDENSSGISELTSADMIALREMSEEILDRMFILKTKFFILPTGLKWVGLTLKGRVRFFKNRLRDLGIDNEFADVFSVPEHQLQSIYQTFKSSNQAELDEIRTQAYGGSRLKRSQKSILRKAARKVIQKYGALPSNAIPVMAREFSLPVDELDFLENTGGGVSGLIRKTRNMLITMSLVGGLGYGGMMFAADQGYISEDVPEQVDSFLGKMKEVASEKAGDALEEGRQQMNRISLERDN